jgi:glycosyltransferase involved in cell wall biosynthesis
MAPLHASLGARMRIAFNAHFLHEPFTGTGRYVYNLLSALGRADGYNEYHLLTSHSVEVRPDTPDTFKWETVPVGAASRAGENVEKVVWEQRTFPAAAKRLGARLAHVPHFAPPMRTHGVPTIITIHDVVPLRVPAYRGSPTAQAYTQLVARAAHHASAIIAISEFTKLDIMEALQIPAERIRVIREAPDPRFRPASIEAQQAVRAKYGLGERFVLNVGGMDARKNISALIGGFATAYFSVGDRELQLFIAGDPTRLGSSPIYPDWQPLAETFGITERIICARVDEEDLPALYSAAAVFAFTSLYEGFGLTPLEAMACGAPVVCSNATALPEVVGVAGMQVDARDPEAVAAGIQRVLESSETAQRLRDWGLAHARGFTWRQVATETIGLYAALGGDARA